MKIFKHFMTITRHRGIVRRYCFKVGLYKQGLCHDLSKYSPTEFLTGAKYYQGDKSPNVAERLDVGYSAAWLHHKGRNRHHLEYWTDYGAQPGTGLVAIEMPRRYLVEMFIDRMAACKVYHGDAYTDRDPLEYFQKGRDVRFMHPESRRQLELLLGILAEHGEEDALRYIKEDFLRK